jgi:hypothetical protein
MDGALHRVEAEHGPGEHRRDPAIDGEAREGPGPRDDEHRIEERRAERDRRIAVMVDVEPVRRPGQRVIQPAMERVLVQRVRGKPGGNRERAISRRRTRRDECGRDADVQREAAPVVRGVGVHSLEPAHASLHASERSTLRYGANKNVATAAAQVTAPIATIARWGPSTYAIGAAAA